MPPESDLAFPVDGVIRAAFADAAAAANLTAVAAASAVVSLGNCPSSYLFAAFPLSLVDFPRPKYRTIRPLGNQLNQLPSSLSSTGCLVS